MTSRLNEALDLLAAVTERARDLRTRRRVVLWGGRPGRDIQVGSIEDRRRQALLNRLTPLSRAMLTASRAVAAQMAHAAVALRRFAHAHGRILADVDERQAAGVERLLERRRMAEEVERELQALSRPRRRLP